MEERKKERIGLVKDSDLVWKQRRERDEKSVHSNTVTNDKVLYRTMKEAKKAEEKLYAEKTEQNRQSKEASLIQKQRQADVRRISQGLDVRNNLLRQEKRLGVEGIVSRKELNKAQASPEYVGKRNPLKVKAKDVKGLEGKTKRLKKAKHRLLPSERRSRLSRARLEKVRAKYRDKEAKKELFVRDANGNKISVERLRKLRGLSKSKAVTKRDTNFAKNYQMSQKKEQGKALNQMKIRRRDEYSR